MGNPDLSSGRLVKTVKFKDPVYVGDPINAVKIFNEKEVDEIILLDIEASRGKRRPNMARIAEITNECFMPVCYGGGIRSVEVIRDLLNIGIEKVSINSYAVENPLLIRKAADTFGSQSIVVALDVLRKQNGKYELCIYSGTKQTGISPLDFAIKMEHMGCGELLINSIDRDGTMSGYDLELISNISNAVSIPVIACGGAGKLDDFTTVIKAGASAAAAGSFFFFQGKHRAVLLSYPDAQQFERLQ
jgi:cyclase